jgi:hypothetical protein
MSTKTVRVNVIANPSIDSNPCGEIVHFFDIPDNTTESDYENIVCTHMLSYVRKQLTSDFKKASDEVKELFMKYDPESIIPNENRFDQSSSIIGDCLFERFSKTYFKACIENEHCPSENPATDVDSFLDALAEHWTSVLMGEVIQGTYNGGVYIVSPITYGSHIGGFSFEADG